jgi:hypothetical protein
MLMNWNRPAGGRAKLLLPGLLLLLLTTTGPGCGQQPVRGGTGGLLSADGNPLPDVQLTVYSAASGEPLGFAVTDSHGAFELVRPGASGALQLDPGSYVVTLESVGAPAILPQEYLDPKSTPLTITTSEGEQLFLDVPDLRLTQAGL